MMRSLFLACLLIICSVPGIGAQDDLLAGHPRESYADVDDIDAMEAALRAHFAAAERYSFSRAWWQWDRLRARYVDGGRRDRNALRILRAVFRGLILDRHEQLAAKGEGDLLYLFYTSLRSGDRKEFVLKVGDRAMLRDIHGGGYHGGWGGASRMRIFRELAEHGMLTEAEQTRFKRIVAQSLAPRLLDFHYRSQDADNHSFGNAGGIAIALQMYEDGLPQRAEARAFIDRIWADLADFGDWTEWNYYPYGPIFLHGLLDIAEATGRIESEEALIRSVAGRCLDWVHGGGIRGNPNSGARGRADRAPVYADPWNTGYYDVETSGRDAHFWYRLAQHYRDPEYLWAAEQVCLGGRPPGGDTSPEYDRAYQRRFNWFVKRGIEPKAPSGGARIGLLSPGKKRIPERLFLRSSREAGKPFASYFLYDKKDNHLDNVAGFLYEYAANGAKFLHSSGKYNNVYSGAELRGGGSGEASLDALLVVHERHPFPLHPNRKGDKRDPQRMGSARHRANFAKAANNEHRDAFGEFAFDDYYGEGCSWIRRSVLTKEGYLIVADDYRGTEGYRAGPVWHLGIDEATREGETERPWFSAPALHQAWWQEEPQRVVLLFHHQDGNRYGAVRQRESQDLGNPLITTHAHQLVNSDAPQRFLSVFVPHPISRSAREVVADVTTTITREGTSRVVIGPVTVQIHATGRWSVERPPVSR